MTGPKPNDDALQRGFGSSGAFPLHRGKDCVGALTVYAGERAYFGDTEIVMLDQLATDITHGMTALAAQHAIAESEETLRASVDWLRDSFVIISPVRDSTGTVVDFRWEYANAAARVAIEAGPARGSSAAPCGRCVRPSGHKDCYRVVCTPSRMANRSRWRI